MASNPPRLYIALYTDEDVHGEMAAQMRARGFDVVSTFEAGNQGLVDAAQLEFAVGQGRAILTHNIGDFERLHARYMQDGKVHFGIIVSSQDRIGEIIRRLMIMMDHVDADQMRNAYHHLAEFK